MIDSQTLVSITCKDTQLHRQHKVNKTHNTVSVCVVFVWEISDSELNRIPKIVAAWYPKVGATIP